MPSLKLTKTAVETARPEARDYELRDTTLAGFICKVTPAGRKVFMLSYRTPTGERRKPSLGAFGALTVDQARKLAQEHLAAVRAGEDPSAERQALRGAPTVKELSERYMEEHCLVHNKPSSARRNKYILKCHIVPKLGRLKVAEVKRPEIAEMISGMRKTPVAANHTLATLRKMFNLVEIWGWRPDGTNPCRHIQKFGGGKRTRLITDEEMVRLYAYLDRADAEGLEHPVLTLAIRLQFEFAARMSEILDLEWEWIDFGQSRVVWPDSKTGGMSKPISAEAMRLLKSAPRYLRSRFVIPSLFDGSKAMSKNTYQAAWRRVLERAGLPHCGTHAVRHRSATDIANSGVPVKVGMALTAHKTVTMFMRYVHTEDDPIRAAAEDDRGVLLAQRLQPFAELAGEVLVVERQPALVDDDERRRAVEPVLDAVEQVGEHGRRGVGADQPLGLERLHGRAAEMLVLGVEQPAPGAADTIRAQRLFDVVRLEQHRETGNGPLGEEAGDARQRLVGFGVEDVEDRADQQGVAGLLPMVALVERAFGVDEDVGDVLDVADLHVAAPHLQQRIVGRGRRVGRIEQQHAAVLRAEARGQRPVLALDVVDDDAARPGQQRRHDEADALA